MGKPRDKRRRGRVTLVFACFVSLAFAAGYYIGRATSTDWNSEQTAFLYACRASYRITGSPDGTLLELRLPDAVYRYDGSQVRNIPNALAVASEGYPILGAEEYESWLN